MYQFRPLGRNTNASCFLFKDQRAARFHQWALGELWEVSTRVDSRRHRLPLGLGTPVQVPTELKLKTAMRGR